MNNQGAKKENEKFSLQIALSTQFVEITKRRIIFLNKLIKLLDSKIPDTKKVNKCIALVSIHLLELEQELKINQRKLDALVVTLPIKNK